MRIKRDEKQYISGESCHLRVFGIADFSVHDGPGIRTVVYFQGCNACCDWCHSPHSQSRYAPLLFNRNLCTDCRRCAAVCPNQVHRFEQGKHEINREACTKCGVCIENCPGSISGVTGSALHLPTVSVSVSGLFDQIEPYIRLSGKQGGITLSGGEALLQLDAAEELILKCKEKGYHVAVETSGLLPLDTYRKVLPLVDLWLFGVRIITGNRKSGQVQHINNVLDLLTNQQSEILPRIPMVPGFFDRDDILETICDLLVSHSIRKICLNPWNKDYGLYYQQSGIPLRMTHPTPDEINFCETKITSFFNQLNFIIYENRTIRTNNDPES